MHKIVCRNLGNTIGNRAVIQFSVMPKRYVAIRHRMSVLILHLELQILSEEQAII